MGEPNYTIHKAAGIIIRDRKILVTRTEGKEIFINPGGRLEEGETVMQALIREHDEELGITVAEEDVEFLGTYYSQAAYQPDQVVRLDAHIIHKWSGEIKAAAEVEETREINSSDIGSLPLASILEHDIIPALLEKGLID